MVEFDPLVKVGHEGEEEVHRDGLGADIKRRDQWWVLHVEAGHDERDELWFSDGFPGRHELI